MRHLSLTFALIILWASSCWAMSPAFLAVVTSGGAVDYCSTSTCASCIWIERFECGTATGDDANNNDNTWSLSSAGVNTTDNYTPAISGTESIFLQAGATASRHNSITASSDDIYIAVKIKPNTFTENNASVIAFSAEGGTSGKITLGFVHSGGIITQTNAGVDVTYDTANDDISSPTTSRYWKFKYNNSSGTDGIFKVWHSETGLSGSWTLRHDMSSLTYTGRITGMRIQSTSNNAYIFDDIRVSSNDINF